MGSKEEIDDLIAAFDRVVHEHYPNPERIGCPARFALTRLATGPRDSESGAVLDHIRECASCLDDLRDLGRTLRDSQGI